jgi:hypothetical protein
MTFAPDFLYTEGCTKYGPAGFNATSLMLTSGDWNTSDGSITMTVAASIAGPGQAMNYSSSLNNNGTGGYWSNLPGNYARGIGSIYVSAPLNQSQGGIGWAFRDNGTYQLGIYLETSGRVTIRAGGPNGTILATSAGSIAANTPFCLGWDIGFNTSTGYWKVYLNGVLDANLNATGQNTARGGVHNYFNQHGPCNQGNGGSGVASTFTWQHVILPCYSSTGGTDTAFSTNPYVRTQLVASDSAVAFTPTAGVLGSAYSATSNTNAPGANELVLRKFTPAVNCTINSVGIMPAATSAGAKFKGVIYSDSAGSPNSLLSSGTEVVGVTSGTGATLALVTPQSLTAATAYWIGYITDTSVALAEVDTSLTGAKAANTYTSGAPGTAPGMTTGQNSWEIWGNLTGMAANYPQVDIAPPADILNYNASSTVNAEDLFAVTSLGATPSNIYAVNVKVRWERSDSGARTADIRCKSNTTTSSGSNTGLSPPLAFGGAGTTLLQDPNGSIAWAAAAVNAMKIGYKITT